MLAGEAFGPHIGKMYDDLDEKRKLGHCFCAINPANFTDLETFLSNMDQMIDELHDSELASGFTKVIYLVRSNK